MQDYDSLVVKITLQIPLTSHYSHYSQYSQYSQLEPPTANTDGKEQLLVLGMVKCFTMSKCPNKCLILEFKYVMIMIVLLMFPNLASLFLACTLLVTNPPLIRSKSELIYMIMLDRHTDH